MVIRPPWNIFIREIVREMAFKGYFVDIGVMLQDPFQGNSEDAFNLVLGPCPFIIIQNTDKGIKSDHTGAGGLFQFSDDLDLVPLDEQFLRRFAHGSFQRKLSGFDPPAGKTDLTGLSMELCCTYFIQNMISPVPDQDRDQYSRTPSGQIPDLIFMAFCDPVPEGRGRNSSHSPLVLCFAVFCYLCFVLFFLNTHLQTFLTNRQQKYGSVQFLKG